MNNRKKLGEILLEKELIDESQLVKILEYQTGHSTQFGESALELGVLSDNQLLRELSHHLDVDFLNIADNDGQVIDPALAPILSYETCRSLNVVPLFMHEDEGRRYLTLAMCDPLDKVAIEQVERASESNVTPILTTRTALDLGIEKLFSDIDVYSDSAMTSEPGSLDVVVLVNQILAQAVHLLASDIHFEPREGETQVRFRIDGVLRMMQTISSGVHDRLIHRLKIMASEKNAMVRTDNRRLSQDGSFARVIGGRAVDFRVSTFPTLDGEKVVVRLLDRDAVRSINSISDVGMPPAVERQFRRSILRSGGIIIATGPTGSGKTTTLYAAINDIHNVGLNIVTVEDPVEYQAPEYVCQSSIKREAGFTYPVAIRAVLRQDPDVILIGEIRDLESAGMAVEAALTGHMILTTLHTEDAAGAIVRLLDIGIEQFMISSTVVSAVNQRLLRRVCSSCAKPIEPPGIDQLVEIGVDTKVAEDILSRVPDFNIRAGEGCPRCHYSGYSGRIGAFEMLTVTPTIKKLILEKQTSDVIAEEARKDSSINMIYEDALRLVLSGETGFEELRRVHRGDYPLKHIEQIIAHAS